MNMKKLISLVLAMLLCLGTFALAESDDLQAQLDAANARIAELESEVELYKPFYESQIVAEYGDGKIIWKEAADAEYQAASEAYAQYGMNIDEMLNVLNKKSGVLVVSGVSSDFRDLDNAAAEGNDRAQLALDMFHYWVGKVVGSYVAAMNGVDAIIFTAGVGENSKGSRAAIAEYFGYLGVEIDPEANSKRGEDIMISTPDSKVKVFVIPTNEELVIARDTKEICG